jgi:hypothetical protein
MSLAISNHVIVMGVKTVAETCPVLFCPYPAKAYVFEQQNGIWQFSNELPSSNSGFEIFGYSVGVSGNTIVVASSIPSDGGFSYMYFFEKSGSNWTRVKKFETKGSLPGSYGGISGNSSFIYQGEYQAVGTFYTFNRVNSTWLQGNSLSFTDNSFLLLMLCCQRMYLLRHNTHVNKV